MVSKKVKVKKPSKAFQQMKAGLEDAVRYAQGDTTGSKTHTLVGVNVNLRSSKDNDALIMKIVKKGSVVELMETDGDWSRIRIDGMVGWIYGRHLHNKS